MASRFSTVEKPANFDPANPRADPVAYLEQKEWATRESLVKVAQAKVGGARALRGGRCFYCLGLPPFSRGVPGC